STVMPVGAGSCLILSGSKCVVQRLWASVRVGVGVELFDIGSWRGSTVFRSLPLRLTRRLKLGHGLLRLVGRGVHATEHRTEGEERCNRNRHTLLCRDYSV